MEVVVRRLAFSLTLLFGALYLSACGGGSDGGSDDPPGNGDGGGSDGDFDYEWEEGVFPPSADFKNQCGSVLAQNHWLRSWSHETYLWYDEIVDRDPADYDNPLKYFELLKTEESSPSGGYKDNYHYAEPTEEYERRTESGISLSYGFQWTILDGDPQQIYTAYSESPDWPAGMERGMRVVRIDDLPMSYADADSQKDVDFINAVLWPSSEGQAHEFEFESRSGLSYTTTLTAGEIDMNPAPIHYQSNIGPGGETVGYLLFNSHVATAEKALFEAVEDFNSNGGIEELVLDLRYNGGGYLGVASQLAYMIAGSNATDGRIFEELLFNDQHPDRNPFDGEPLEPIPFIDVTVGYSSLAENLALPTLDLDRVFVLSGQATCSASESIINGLRGIGVEVILIGDTTCGKPYGFYPTGNCGTTYFTINYKGANDEGFGEYADGFIPNSYDDGYALVEGCEVSDDFDHALGDTGERRLAAALNYMDSGSCGVYASSYARVKPMVADGGEVNRIAPPEWQRNRIVQMPRRSDENIEH